MIGMDLNFAKLLLSNFYNEWNCFD